MARLGGLLVRILCVWLPFFAMSAKAQSNDFTLEITESAALLALDRPGVRSFATILNLAAEEKAFLDANTGYTKLKLLRLSQLQTSGWFQTMRTAVTADVNEFVKNSGLKMTKVVESSADERPRYFDTDWLLSKDAAMKLVAVVNRVDRMDFDPNSCGELRFIYRLGYHQRTNKSEQFSMLPLFMNVVYEYQGGDCASIARLWNLRRKDFAGPEEFVTALLNGPLNTQVSKFKQIELNMQTVRFSSEDKVDFGGQAIYLFRIFEPNTQNALIEKPLENQPDVTAILADKQLRADLLRQLSNPANFDRIDTGTFTLENTGGRLLAKRALSFSTVGRARMGNKPFSFLFLTGKAGGDWRALFNKDELAQLSNLPYAQARFVKSPLGLIERMNNVSCVGCHQSNGTAGFHMLGRHFEMDTTTNRTAVPFSPHFYAERFRKAQYLTSMVSGTPVNRFRPHSMATPAHWETAAGDGNKAPVLSGARVKELCLKSAEHLNGAIGCLDPRAECVTNAANTSIGIQFGECMYKKDQAAAVTAGLACRFGTVTNGFDTTVAQKTPALPFNFFSFRDTYLGPLKESDPMPSQYYSLPATAVCGKPKGGVPVGRVRKECTPDTPTGMLTFADELLADVNKNTEAFNLPADMCAVRGGAHIDACAATPNVSECLSKTVVPRSMLDVCTPSRFCREDYLCQQLPLEIALTYKDSRVRDQMTKRIRELNRRNIGFCVPNYFVFNMRIDGHPRPGK